MKATTTKKSKPSPTPTSVNSSVIRDNESSIMDIDADDHSLKASTQLDTATDIVESGSKGEADLQKHLGNAQFYLYL
jgi:hypothetical protein